MQKRYKGGMNLRHLHAFATVADAGGVARAATRLHVSQPALSRQIQALESELGVPLFDRIGRNVRLTSAGEDLLRRSRRVLAETDSLAGFLSHYRRRHPGVEVHLVEDGGVRLHGRLERGDVHLIMAPAGDMRFRDRLLYPMHLLAALPPGHRLSRRATLEVADLADEPLLLLRRDFASREWLDTA
jgi:LysR family cyn operon transcriptional activator